MPIDRHALERLGQSCGERHPRPPTQAALGKLANKIVILTGASSGMGAATAGVFASEGATVIAVDLQPPVTQPQSGNSGKIVFYKLDVVDEAGWVQLAAHAKAAYGRIDVLVNNAGILHYAPIDGTTAQDFERVIRVNLIGPYLGVRAVAPIMIEQKSGSIINISSANGLRSCCNMTAYDASKWGIRGLTKSLALELGAHNIRVNSVHPGVIETPMMSKGAKRPKIAMERFGDAREVARVSAFLASDESSYVSGAELAVDGAWTAGVFVERAQA